MVYNVPYVKYEYVPVEEKCSGCCCGGWGNGDTKIVNNTSVNWVGGKGKTNRGYNNFEDASEAMGAEKKHDNKPKDWSDVLERFE